jgi:hypothetical protein
MRRSLSPDPRCSIKAVRVGDEQQPVILIDDFLAEASELIEHAATNRFLPLDGLYPGLHCPVPSFYPEALFHALIGPIGQVFELRPDQLADVASDFRMVTFSPDTLQVRQRLPHYDLTDPNLIVILHYLAPPGFGGTSLYRHRRTRFEGITPVRQTAFETSLAEELQSFEPQGFMHGDNRLFERIASFPAAFNRAIVYRGNVLHSGDILPDPLHSADPRTGRLTASTLFTFKPKSEAGSHHA